MNTLVRDVARVTVELVSPLAIGSGAWDDLMDSPFVLDASGLPTIPGSSLAGVLRAAWRDEVSETDAKRLFGYQDRAADGSEDGAPSKVEVSFAILHDATNRPVAPRLRESEIEADPLLRSARVGWARPHVRINHQGTADAVGAGLFDRSQVPVGHRFTLEITVVDDESGDDLDRLVGLLEAGSVRLGAQTHSGLGRLELKAARRRRFDLREAEDYRAYCDLPVNLAEVIPDGVLPDMPRDSVRELAGRVRAATIVELSLRPRGFWLIGGGQPDTEGPRPVDIAPYREPRIVWQPSADGTGEQGFVEFGNDEFPLPASSIKGALRHRTAFHLNRLNGTWAADGGDPTALFDIDGLRHPEVCGLFGEALEHGDDGEVVQGIRGRVDVEEIRVAPEGRSRIPHVALDRFTSGPIDGALYSEEALWRSRDGEPWRVAIRIAPPARGAPNASARARKALTLAIEDLAAARLQIGAGSGRGHGWLEGSLNWQNATTFLDGVEVPHE